MTEDQFDHDAYLQKMQNLKQKYAIKKAREDFKKLNAANRQNKNYQMGLSEEACDDATYLLEMNRLLEAEAEKKKLLLKKQAEQSAIEDFAQIQEADSERHRARAQEEQDRIDKELKAQEGMDTRSFVFAVVGAVIWLAVFILVGTWITSV